jgi:hypothetical protein
VKRVSIFTLLMIVGAYGTAYIGTLSATWWSTATLLLSAVFTFVCVVAAIGSLFWWLDQ